MLWIDFSESRFDFLKNFLDISSESIKKQGILNLSSYSSKSDATVVLGDSEVTFLEEEVDTAFVHFSVLFIFSFA